MSQLDNTHNYTNLWDTHAHLDHYHKAAWPNIQKICEFYNITLFGVSMDIPSYKKICALANQFHFIIPWFGIHPWRAHEYANNLNELDYYLETATHIGEIGLDKRFLKEASPWQDQIQVFNYQLQHSAVTNKWLNLHTSGAESEILTYLKQYHPHKNIIHWYNGPLHLINHFLDIGCYFTVPLEILFNQSIREIIQKIPLDRLLLETDNPGGWPWLLDLNNQPQTSPPALPDLIFKILPHLAELKTVSIEKVVDQIRQNQQKII